MKTIRQERRLTNDHIKAHDLLKVSKDLKWGPSSTQLSPNGSHWKWGPLPFGSSLNDQTYVIFMNYIAAKSLSDLDDLPLSALPYLHAEKLEDWSWKDNRKVIHEKNSGRTSVFRFLSTKTDISIFARTSQRQSLLPSEMKDDLRRLSSSPWPAMNLQSPAAHLHTHFPHLPISIEAFPPLRIAPSVAIKELQHQKKRTSLQRFLRNWPHVTTRRGRTAYSLSVSRLLTSTRSWRELPNDLPDRRGLLASILDHFHLQALQEMKRGSDRRYYIKQARN